MREAASEAAGAALQALGIEGVSRGAHVELVLRQAIQLLGSRCLHLPNVQQYLLQLVFRFELIYAIVCGVAHIHASLQINTHNACLQVCTATCSLQDVTCIMQTVL